MKTERTELIVNLNLLPEPTGEFMLKHLNDFSTPLPKGVCEEHYVQRVHVLGLIIQKYTPQRILDAYASSVSGRAFSKFGITSDGVACIRFTAAWPQREAILVGFADTADGDVNHVDINSLLSDTERMLCYLGRGDSSDAFFHAAADTAPITREEFVGFAESVIGSIVALTAEYADNAAAIGGYGDMSWLSLLIQNGVLVEKQEQNERSVL